MTHNRDIRTISFSLFIISIFISVVVTLMIVQSIAVENERRGCERRQPIFEEIARTVEDAASASQDNLTKAIFEARAEKIRENIVTNCDEAYDAFLPSF